MKNFEKILLSAKMHMGVIYNGYIDDEQHLNR